MNEMEPGGNENEPEGNNQRTRINDDGNYVTRFGREIRPVERYGDLAAMALTEAEYGYQVNLREIAKIEFEISGVGAGLGGGFENTRQLKPMKYDEAMRTDKVG